MISLFIGRPDRRSKLKQMSVVVLNGVRPQVRTSWASPPDEETWTYLGGNSGNLFWRFATERLALLATHDLAVIPHGVDVLHEPAFSDVLLNARAVVYPTANLLMNREDVDEVRDKVC